MNPNHLWLSSALAKSASCPWRLQEHSVPWSTAFSSLKGWAGTSLQVGRLAAQTREQQRQLKVNLFRGPRLQRSQADTTLDVMWVNRHFIDSDALWSGELGGKWVQSNCPGRLVHITGVWGSAHFISSPTPGRYLRGNKTEWHPGIIKQSSRVEGGSPCLQSWDSGPSAW